MEIPVFVSEGEPVKMESVPDEWMEQSNHSKEVKNELEDRISDISGFRGTARKNASSKIDEYSLSEIVVFAAPDSELVERGVPDEIEGVSVSLVEEEELTDASYRQGYDPVKGGVHGKATPAAVRHHTVTCRVEYNGDSCLLVPRHPFCENRCSTNLATRECFQNGSKFGDIIDDWQELDVAVARCSNNNRNGVSRKIVDQVGEIEGHTTEKGVEFLQSRGVHVHKRGIGTGRQSGEIFAVDRSVPCEPPAADIKNAVMSKLHQKPGDSGAPVYYADESQSPPDLYIVHVATQMKNDVPNLGSGTGAAAWHISDVSNVSF